MQTLKKPEMILSIANSTVLVGAVVYFYKQINAMQSKITDLEEKLSSSIKRMGEFQEATRDYPVFKQGIRQLDDILAKNTEASKELKEDQLELKDLIELIGETMNQGGLPIDLEPQQKKKRGKKGKRQENRSSRREPVKPKPEKDDSSSDSDE